MSVMATKIKASTADFLSGDGIDLNVPKKITTGNISNQEQDDLDLLLSEITVQFDDEVQTLYVGPVEIVDDDDDEGNGGVVDSKTNNRTSGTQQTTVLTQKETIECKQQNSHIPPTTDITATVAVIESVNDVIKEDANSAPAVVTKSISEAVVEQQGHLKQQEPPVVKVTDVPTQEPIEATVIADSAIAPVADSLNCVIKKDSNSVSSPVITQKTTEAAVERREQLRQLPPSPNLTLPVAEIVVVEESKKAAAVVVDSANDDRPHRLTEAAVVIDPKNGGESQTVSSADIKKTNRSKTKVSPDKTRPLTISASVSTRRTKSSNSPVKSAPAKPTAVISPSTKRKVPSDQSLLKPAGKRLKVPNTIKEEIKQLSPVLPRGTENNLQPEDKPQLIDSVAYIEKSSLKKKEYEEKLEQKEVNAYVEPEEEERTQEGELIVPDVVVPAEERQLLEYNVSYSKDSSPAGSDSGIENEGTDLNKTVLLPVPALVPETNELSTESIPEGSATQAADSSEAIVVVNDNTHLEPVSTETEPLTKNTIRVIKCAKCFMTFKRDLWYKKHLMNYHGIDLSNIAHFLSNLQTLDEDIEDEANEQSVDEELQLNDQTSEVHNVNKKTDANADTDLLPEKSAGELEGPVAKRLRPKVPSTPSPATLQMYPEVKLSTSNGKGKQPRRRKDKLVPRNTDAGMKIKHEYHAAVTASEESTSGSSQSSQPLLNDVFVVTYLERTFLTELEGGATASTPATNEESSKPSKAHDPLAVDMTPFERVKIVETGTEDKPSFTCHICASEFDQLSAAQDHVNYVHKDVKRRSCPHCGRTFTQTGDLTRHVRIHTGIRPFKCPFEDCKYAFISSGDLHKHVRRHNQHINPIPKPHVCVDCGKDFERGYDLKRHSSMHAKDDPNHVGFNCELCGKTFARKDQYRAHTYRHIGYKPHKCTHCSKSFSDASNYAKHLKVHEMDGIVLFCHHCEKPFKNKMAISKHVFHCKYKKKVNNIPLVKRIITVNTLNLISHDSGSTQ